MEDLLSHDAPKKLFIQREVNHITTVLPYNINTDLPAYSDTVYSDTLLTVTLLACPERLVCY